MKIWKRLLIAALLIGPGYCIARTASGGALQALALLLFGFAAMIVGAVILAFPLARLVAESSGSLFFPSKRLNRAWPMYSIPESKRTQGLYEESITGFERIAEDYADELKPYLEMIDILIRNLKDAARAEVIYQHGMSLLKSEKDKAVLAGMYTAIRSRLNAKPSN